MVLSGMSAMEQVEENVASADASGVNTLTAEELALFDQVREKYQELCPIPCSACIQCRECEELCPQSILISEWMPIVHEVLGEGRPYICELP